MKKTLFTIFILLITLGSFAEGYSLFIKLPAFANREIILGKYIDDKVYPNDTLQLNQFGEGTFQGENKLEMGLYMLVFNAQPVIEFLLGKEQNIAFHQTDVGIEIAGSKPAAQFLNYQQLIRSANKEKDRLVRQISKATEAEKESITHQLDAIEDSLLQFMNTDIQNYKGSMYADFLNATKPFVYPEDLQFNLVSTEIQNTRYAYQRDHFMDEINFHNLGLINTPVFKSKLQFYLNKVLIQHPDSIVPAAMQLLKMDMDAAIFQYLSGYLLNYAQNSKLMGMDRLLVEVAEYSYLSGRAFWVNEAFLKELRIKVRMTKPNLIGKTAPELTLYNINNEFISLNDVDADYTILVFWEVDCGHCQIEMPKLKELLDIRDFSKDVKVFAVHTDNKYDQWLEAISKYNIEDWVNAYNKENATLFKIDYNVTQTPMLYVLDQHKTIISKNIGIEQVVDFIQRSSTL